MEPRLVYALVALTAASACDSEEASARQQASSNLNDLVRVMKAANSVDPAIDVDALGAVATNRLLTSTADERTAEEDGVSFFFRGLQKGHTGVFTIEGTDEFRKICRPGLPAPRWNTAGVCLAPHGQDFIVTFASRDNPGGLHAGDLITRIGEWRGSVLREHFESVPFCGALSPSESGRKQHAARAVVAMTEPGTEMEVVDPTGAHRIQPFPAATDSRTDCFDVFGRAAYETPSVATRADGVRVIRVGSFAWGTHPQMISDIERIAKNAADAERVVWDLRGNAGGAGGIAARLAGFLPSMPPQNVLSCSVVGAAVPTEDVHPELPTTPLLAKTLRTAVLVDGATYSSGSRFVRMAARSSALLVGTEDAGAYSNDGLAAVVGSTHVRVDQGLCRDSETNAVAEGHPPAVGLRVEYDPTALLEGRDTVLEQAVNALADGGGSH